MDKSSCKIVCSMLIRPAIDAGSSVSRVGELPKSRLWRKLRVLFVSTSLPTVNWKPSREVVTLDAATQAKLNRGRRTVGSIWNNLFMNLWRLKNKSWVLYALTHGFLDSIPVDDILRFQERVVWLLWSTLWSNLWDDSFDTWSSSRRGTGCSPYRILSTSQISNRNRRWKMAVSLNDIKIKLHPLKIPVKLQCHADGVCC